jgi:hypothetical protein
MVHGRKIGNGRTVIAPRELRGDGSTYHIGRPPDPRAARFAQPRVRHQSAQSARLTENQVPEKQTLNPPSVGHDVLDREQRGSRSSRAAADRRRHGDAMRVIQRGLDPDSSRRAGTMPAAPSWTTPPRPSPTAANPCSADLKLPQPYRTLLQRRHGFYNLETSLVFGGSGLWPDGGSSKSAKGSFILPAEGIRTAEKVCEPLVKPSWGLGRLPSRQICDGPGWARESRRRGARIERSRNGPSTDIATRVV